MKATAVDYTDSSKYSEKSGYILTTLYDTVDEATRFQDQTINVLFQNSIKIGLGFFFA